MLFQFYLVAVLVNAFNNNMTYIKKSRVIDK